MKEGLICNTLTKTQAVRIAEKAIEEKAERVIIFPVVKQIANDLPRGIPSATLCKKSVVDYGKTPDGIRLYKAEYTIQY